MPERKVRKTNVGVNQFDMQGGVAVDPKVFSRAADRGYALANVGGQRFRIEAVAGQAGVRGGSPAPDMRERIKGYVGQRA